MLALSNVLMLMNFAYSRCCSDFGPSTRSSCSLHRLTLAFLSCDTFTLLGCAACTYATLPSRDPGWVNVPMPGDDYIHYVDRMLRTPLDCLWHYYLYLIRIFRTCNACGAGTFMLQHI